MAGVVPLHQGGAQDLAASVAADVARLGVSAATDVISPERVRELRDIVDRALVEDDRWHRPEDVDDIGRVTFLPRYSQIPLDLLVDEAVMGPCDAVIGSDAMLYTLTTLCQPPRSAGRPVHVDTRYWVPDFVVGLGITVLLDDFTPETGPTRFHPDITLDEPSAEEFEERALRLEAPAGSACWFHGRIWHDVPPNRTDQWRRSILIAMVRPWARQRFDMPAMVAHLDVDSFPDALCQRLGFGAIAPRSYDEYYLPHAVRRKELLRRSIDQA